MLTPMRIATLLGKAENPLLLLFPGNGSLTAYERANPRIGDGRSKALTMTGSGAVRYQAAPGARTNYFANPQLGTGATGWSNAGSATGGRTADTDFASGQCWESVATASTSDGPNVVAQMRNVSLSAATITVGVAAKVTAGATDWQARAQLVDAAGSVIGSAGSYVDLVPGASVARAVLSITNPTQVGGMGVQVQFRRKTAATSTLRVSDLTIESGATAGSWFAPVWLDPITGVLGTAHASASVSQAVAWVKEGTTNLITNPLSENALNVFLTGGGGMTYTINRVTNYAWMGSASTLLDVTVIPGGMHVAIGNINASIAATAGLAYSAQTRLRGTPGSVVTIAIVFRSSGGGAIASTNSGNITLADSWQYVSLENIVAPANTAWVEIRLNVTTVGQYYVDGVQLEQKTYCTSFAAGSMGTGYSWGSTAHASASTRTAVTDKTDETNRIDWRKGSLFLRYYRSVDTGSSQTLFDVGDGTAGKDRLTLRINASDKFEMGWTSNGSAETTIASVESIAIGTWYYLYVEWDGTRVALSVDNGAMITGTRNAPQGSLATSNDMAIGSLNTGSAQADGLIALGIANRPLTLRESARAKATSLWTWRALDAA